MVQRLKILYKEILPQLIKEFNYKNEHQIPKIEKIQINRSLGLSASNTSILKKSIEEFMLITGQKPVITKAKKAIAGFKIREKMDIGLTVTLRNERMYAFLDKLINNQLEYVTTHYRDFIHIEDLCDAIELLIESQLNGTLDIGDTAFVASGSVESVSGTIAGIA